MMAKDNLSGDDGFPSAKGGRAALAAIAHHSTVLISDNQNCRLATERIAA